MFLVLCVSDECYPTAEGDKDRDDEYCHGLECEGHGVEDDGSYNGPEDEEDDGCSCWLP